jgi:protein-S-isoprenylcysteine O-methyltransferase Ste14
MPIPEISVPDVPLHFVALLVALAYAGNLVLLLALVMYASATWASMRYFDIDDAQARAGKRLVSVGAGCAMVLTLARLLLDTVPSPAVALIAVVIYGLGIVLFWWAWLTTRNHRMDFAFTSRAPQSINTAGPYAFMRHPYYIAYMLGWLAPLVYLQDGIALAVLSAMALTYWRAALKEERLIASSSVAELYAAHTKRMGPSALDVSTLLRNMLVKFRS